MNTKPERIRRPINLTISAAARRILAGWRFPSRYVDALVILQDQRWRAQWAALADEGLQPAAIERLIRAYDARADLLAFEYLHGNPNLIALLPPIGGN